MFTTRRALRRVIGYLAVGSLAICLGRAAAVAADGPSLIVAAVPQGTNRTPADLEEDALRSPRATNQNEVRIQNSSNRPLEYQVSPPAAPLDAYLYVASAHGAPL